MEHNLEGEAYKEKLFYPQPPLQVPTFAANGNKSTEG